MGRRFGAVGDSFMHESSVYFDCIVCLKKLMIFHGGVGGFKMINLNEGLLKMYVQVCVLDLLER